MCRLQIIILFFILSFTCTWAQNEKVSFPFFLTLQDGTEVPDGLFLPQAEKNNARFTKEGLFLTRQSQFQFGAILMKDMSFTSSNGIEISFEFNVYGGKDESGTDGFIVFLYDAAIKDEDMFMGATGRSMGYVFNRSGEDNKNKRQKGLPGAYLGVGLNMSGNFKVRSFINQYRINGIKGHKWKSPKSDIPGPSHITLRGAEYKLPAGDAMFGYRGYPVLKTVSTLKTDTETDGSGELKDDGTYSFGPSFSKDISFSLRNGGIGENENDDKFRKAFISLIPHKEGGFIISVKIQHGSQLSTVIDKYHYKTKISYYENAEAKYSDFETTSKLQNVIGSDVKLELDASVPERFKVGFAGITGGRVDVHMIRNLLISVPYAAVATDKAFDVCETTMSQFYPFEKDYAYGGHISDPKAGSSLIDPNSFVFYPIEGGQLIDVHHYSDENGLWSYNPKTTLISFQPKGNFSKNGARVRYSIKGKGEGQGEPYGEEMYRSNPAIITLNPLECPIYVNPNIQIKSY